MAEHNALLADKISGAVLGCALGDAFGAPYEGGIVERAVWAVIGKQNGRRRWTDDTQMTLDVIESLIACESVDQDDLANRFANSYRWSRGYGPGAARVLKRIRRGVSWQSANLAVYCEGSYGNGGAMRAAPIGLFFVGYDEEVVFESARAVAAVTHAHPLGQEGAGLVALATCLAYRDTPSSELLARLQVRASSPEFLGRLQTASAWCTAGEIIAPRRVATELGNGIAASESSITAIFAAMTFRHHAFDELQRFVITLGGDVDTIGAMAGAIWGASRGISELPQAKIESLEDAERIQRLAVRFADVIGGRAKCG